MKKLILVVDDEESIRSILTESLGFNGYEVATASSVVAGLRAAQQSAPQLVISDLQMADSDGLEMIGRLKDLIPGVPVILLTGVLFEPRAADELLSHNVSCYLPKTSSLAEIMEAVRGLIGPGLVDEPGGACASSGH